MERPTGHHVDYYLVEIKHAQRGVTGIVECDDIIEALGLTFAEGCVFKEIWRTARARQGVGKPGHTQRYGREKVKHYADFLYDKEIAIGQGDTTESVRASSLKDDRGITGKGVHIHNERGGHS